MLHIPVFLGISVEPKDDGLEPSCSAASSFRYLSGNCSVTGGQSHVLRNRPEGDRKGTCCGRVVSAGAGVQSPKTTVALGRRVVLKPADLDLPARHRDVCSSRGEGSSSDHVTSYPQAPHQPLLTTRSLKKKIKKDEAKP